MDDINNNTVGKWVSKWIDRHKLSREKIVEKFGYSVNYIISIEKGLYLPARKDIEVLYIHFPMSLSEYKELLDLCTKEYSLSPGRTNGIVLRQIAEETGQSEKEGN